MTTAPAAGKRDSVKLVAVASFIGTTIEWYDFFLYNTAAALVFNKLFFPTLDPFTGTLSAYGTYAVGFLARPLVAPSSAITATGSAARRCWSGPSSSWESRPP